MRNDRPLKQPVVHLTNVHGADNYRVHDRELVALSEICSELYYIVPGVQDKVVNGIRFLGVKERDSEWKRALFTGLEVFRKAIKLPQNSILHFHSPEWIPYALLAKILGRTVIYDVHEDVPRQVYTKTWIPGILKPLVSVMMSFMESIMVSFADRVVACEPVTFKRFQHNKTILLRNFPLMSEFGSLPEVPKKINRIIYVGQIFKERGIKELIRALAKTDPGLNIELVLGGKFVPKELLAECKELEGWEKVDFRGYMSREEVVKEMTASAAGILVLHPIRKYKESYPVKLFEYMAAGIPILMSDFPKWKEIVDPLNIYLTTDPMNVDEIAEQIESIIRLQNCGEIDGKEGREAFQSRYNWDSEKQKLIKMYLELTASE